ncbi:UPF0122 protein [Kroppenstedtia guangzhouensis]|jgi:uncharacterized protein|uniref:UPF0122 protein GCM10007416_02750 n=1 Tax=Kroppenstedtia guangzhouensis TaxID=1274356 RepID=A0ABQ1FXP2_9BACL|nr:YlxM family DNA-binding protein [Kroppenstedtia guangzhouensis]GGA33478.1 UPF0122 protein [Kroppenstedtia guangzhouensis]
MLEETTRVNLLYDFYAPLLTEKQRQVMELYFYEDWSFGEIANHLGISRQGVHETVKRSRSTMENLEEELGLLTKHLRRRELADRILERLEGHPTQKDVEELLKELLGMD